MAFTENSPRSPEQIWSWIQTSLRADMPRANYEILGPTNQSGLF